LGKRQFLVGGSTLQTAQSQCWNIFFTFLCEMLLMNILAAKKILDLGNTSTEQPSFKTLNFLTMISQIKTL